MKIILKYGKLHKLKFLVLFISIIVTSIFSVVYPYLFGLLVDEVFTDKNMNFFIFIVIIYFVVYMLEQIFHYFLNMSWANLTVRFAFDIRKDLFRKVFKLKSKDLDNSSTGDIITIINKDTGEFLEYITRNVFYLIMNVIRLVLTIGIIFYINVRLGIIAVVLSPVVVILTRYFGEIYKNYNKEYRTMYGKHISKVFEFINSIRDLRLLASTPKLKKIYEKESSELVEVKIKSDYIELTSERSTAFIGTIATLTIYGASAYLIVNEQLTIGMFIAALDYFNRSRGFINWLSKTYIDGKRKNVSMDKVKAMLMKDEEENYEDAKDIIISKGDIIFKNVSFGYNEKNLVLEKLNLNISKGEKIAIVGYSGHGKSSIAKLLIRLYDISSGMIKIDNQDISQVTSESLRNQIGFVFQTSYIFPGTIKENLLLGCKNDISDEELLKACKKVKILKRINELPEKLETEIGFGNVELSGGEKQRIALARTLLKDPKVVVLDEATSALDNDTEKSIIDNMDKLFEGKTVIVISHRLSTITNVDKIAVINKGKLEAYDKHDSLLLISPTYKNLFKEQLSGGGSND